MSDSTYHLEMDDPGPCDHCNAGATWIICDRNGVTTRPTYENHAQAYELCDAMNDAHALGMAAAFKIVSRRVGPENRRHTDIATPPEGIEERRRNGKGAYDGRRKYDDGIPF